MPVALITGGSSGIGYEMSRYFAKGGYQLLWASLEEEELSQGQNQTRTGTTRGLHIDTFSEFI